MHRQWHDIPKEQLTAMLGKEIYDMTWFFLADYHYYGIAEPGKFEFSEPSERYVEVYLTEVSNYNMTGFVDVSAETAMFSGYWTLKEYIYYHDIEVQQVSVTFDEQFVYNGNNIMVTVIDRTGQEYNGDPCDSLGVYTGASSWYIRSNSESYSAATTTGGYLSNAAPATRFGYEEGNERAITVTPYNITTGTLNSGGSVYLQTDNGTDGVQTTGYSKEATLDSTATIRAIAPGNYDFVEWRKNSPTGAVFSTNAEESFNVTGAIKLYAVFKKNSILCTGSCGENLTYKLTENGVMTVTGTGAMDDYTSGSVPWNEYRDSITTVTIGNGVTYIGTDAFEYCDGITSVTLGDTVQSIGKYAFYSCDNLANINLPDSLTTLGSQVFSGTALTTVSIPSGITAIPAAAFKGCKSLTTITIPKSVTSIGSGAFYNCTALSTVNYYGTESDWSKISIDTHNDPLRDAPIYFLGAAYTPGDINGDGSVNNKDLTRLFQYLSDWDVEVNEAALDVNGDGSVNNKDLTRLFQYLSDWDVEIF